MLPKLLSGKRSLRRLRAVLSGRDIRLRHADGVPAVLRKRIVGTTSPHPRIPTAKIKEAPGFDPKIGRCPGGTKGSLTPREDRPDWRARQTLTPPCRRLRGPQSRLLANKTRGCPRWTCFARRIGPWSARPTRPTDRGPAAARGETEPIPHYVRPWPPFGRSSRPKSPCEPRFDRGGCPLPVASSLAGALRRSRVPGPTEARPPSPPERPVPCGTRCSPNQPESMPNARIRRRRSFALAWPGTSGGRTTVAKEKEVPCHPRLSPVPNPTAPETSVQPVLPAPQRRSAAVPASGLRFSSWLATKRTGAKSNRPDLSPRSRLPRPRVSKCPPPLNNNRQDRRRFLLIKLRVTHISRTFIPQTCPQPVFRACGKLLAPCHKPIN